MYFQLFFTLPNEWEILQLILQHFPFLTHFVNIQILCLYPRVDR